MLKYSKEIAHVSSTNDAGCVLLGGQHVKERATERERHLRVWGTTVGHTARRGENLNSARTRMAVCPTQESVKLVRHAADETHSHAL